MLTRHPRSYLVYAVTGKIKRRARMLKVITPVPRRDRALTDSLTQDINNLTDENVYKGGVINASLVRSVFDSLRDPLLHFGRRLGVDETEGSHQRQDQRRPSSEVCHHTLNFRGVSRTTDRVESGDGPRVNPGKTAADDT
jgi:hypothetical protein